MCCFSQSSVVIDIENSTSIWSARFSGLVLLTDWVEKAQVECSTDGRISGLVCMHSRLKVVGMGCMGDEKWNSRLYFLRACWTHLARPGLARWNVECSIYYEKGRITFIIRSIIWWLTVTQGLHARTTCDDWKVIKLCEISSNLFYFCRVFFFFSSVGKSSQCIIFFSLSIPRKLFHDSHRRDHDDDSLPCTQNNIFPFSPNKVNL